MIYGREKVRQMQRSILPSTARKAARDNKRALVHRNRRGSSHVLTKYKGPASHVLDICDDGEVLTYWETPNRHDYGEMIYERRSHDKLAHFEMWAYERTKHLRLEDRYSKISGLLPNGLIGDHALSHLEFLQPPHAAEYWRYRECDYYGLPTRLRRKYYYYNRYTPPVVGMPEVPEAGS